MTTFNKVTIAIWGTSAFIVLALIVAGVWHVLHN